MGHNSFIKSFITHVSLGGSLVILVQHSTAATFGFLEGVVVAAPLAVPVRAQSTPAAVAVLEVSSVELRSFHCLSFSHKSLVSPGMIHRPNINF